MIALHDDYCIGMLFVWTASLFIPWPTHVLANPVGMRKQFFVATDAERSDCVHLHLGAWQRLRHKSEIPSLNHTSP